MLMLIRISLVIIIFSQQALSLEQPLDQNHFGQITFDSQKPLIESWTSCFPDCSLQNNNSIEINNDKKKFLKILNIVGESLNNYTMTSQRSDDDFEVIYSANENLNQIPQIIFKKRVESDLLELIIQSNNQIEIQIDLDNLLSEEDIYGLGGIYNGGWLVRISDQGVENLSILSESKTEADSWVGARSRFWSFLISSPNQEFYINEVDPSDRSLKIISMSEDGVHSFKLYFGPLNTKKLTQSDLKLRELMYSALWDWLRQLCFLIEWIFVSLLTIFGNPGIAILLLALILKVIIYPLNQIAEKWQDDVNIIQSSLQPQIDEIKSSYSGEEANSRIMKLYKDKSISPFYSIKSLFGFLIQIPIFIAVFDVLGESIHLLGQPFLFIDNLSKPDQWLDIPFFIPYFGSSFNLLPLLMMLISMISAYLYSDINMNIDLENKKKNQLYLMSLLFFILFFTFPSGMVLYWTSSNVLQLIRILYSKDL